MALITSAASGNFNSAATWTGGVVPGANDEARVSDTHTVTITANVTVQELSNAGTGIFTLNSGVTLTANVTNKSSTTSRNCLQFTSASPASAFIVGNITGGNVATAVGVTNTSSGTLNITGNCVGGTAANCDAVTNTSTGTLNITGNCTASGQASSGARNSGSGILNVTGNCTGGSGSTSHGVINVGSATLNITGSCFGGASTGNFGAYNQASGSMTVSGGIYASEFDGGVGSGQRSGLNFLTGPFYISNTWGVNPNRCVSWRWATTLSNTTFVEVPTSNLAVKRNLVTPDNATNFPAASNVRSGTTYGIGGELTGTCVVPSPSSVAAGVNVDNTIGTLTTPTASQVAAAVRTELATELGRIDAAISSRLAPNGTLATVTNLTNAPASVTPADIWSHATRTITGGTVDTLTNAPTVPSASAIASQVRTELTTELGRIDAAVSTRATPANVPTADIAAIKSKTDALNTDRLAQVATTNIVGTLLAQANS